MSNDFRGESPGKSTQQATSELVLARIIL